MGVRPAKCYRRLERPYTRQSRKKPRKGYVKGVPDSKIHRFEMGNRNKNFPRKFTLVSGMDMQIRHNALEAARMAAHKILVAGAGEEGYFMKILVYPFHVMRENPLATGAGADRYQSGMRLSFGKPIGLAARVRKKQKLIDVWIEEGKEEVAKKALRTAGYKLPGTCRVVS
jgi:large subunit ribosomal protein L10e